jgi:hypothetical protein
LQQLACEQVFQPRGRGPNTAARAELHEPRGLPNASLRRILDVGKERQRRMPRFQMRRSCVYAAEDNGQFIIEVASRCRGDDVSTIDPDDSFHNSIVSATSKSGSRRGGRSSFKSMK